MSKFYREFEDRFRGGREFIRARLEQYSPFLDLLLKANEHPKSVDLGCGRGEWLDLVDQLGFDATGVDLDDEMLSEPRAAGRSVFRMDAIEYLQSLEAGGVSLVTAFHLAEHLPFDRLQKLIQEAFRVLAPGGLLILETPNPENLVVAATTFHIDPTHNRPLVPQLLQFAVEFEGFSPALVMRLQEEPAIRQRRTSLRDVLLGVSPDYAVVGRKAVVEKKEAVPEVFSRQWGIDLSELLNLFEQRLNYNIEKPIKDLKRITVKSEKKIVRMQSDIEKLSEELHINSYKKGDTRQRIFQNIDEVKAELSSIRNEFGNFQFKFDSDIEDLKRAYGEASAMRTSASWKLTRPLRVANRYLRAAINGAHAWLTFKPQSRPERFTRRSLARAHVLIQKNPSLYRLARRALGGVPFFEQRVRRLVIPEHLSAAVVPDRNAFNAHLVIEPESVRLVYERLEFARTILPDSAESTCRVEPGLLRLAYLSPLPPERSGIADFSAQLVPELSKYYDVTLIATQGDTNDDWLKQNCSIRSVEWFEKHAHEFDRIMYHFGNSLFHSHMIPLLRRIPGVVVLHDFFLSNMIAYLELYGGWGNHWTNSLIRSHGYEAIRLRAADATMKSAIDLYPANFDVLSQATGLIVHSRHPSELAVHFYPSFRRDAWEMVPLPRVPPIEPCRERARSALGFSQNDFIVCSFGFLGPNKLNHRLLNAWLDSPLAQNRDCKLVFVGAAHEDQYCHDLIEKIAARGSGRVTVSGFASPEIYIQYLQAADVGVQLRANSRGETSAAVLDCMSYGLPTIANAHGSMAELPADCIISLPDSFSDSALSDELVALYEDEARRFRVGSRAAEYVAESHNVAYAAERYHAALEKFYTASNAAFDHKKLIECAAQLPEHDVRGTIGAARELAGRSGRHPRPSKQVLVDVSALKHHDLRTGIQRVVRAVLLEMSKNLPPEFRLEPVWINKDQGEWRYHYARQYMLDFLGIGTFEIGDDPVDVGEGDVFVALDFFAHGVIGAAHTGLYARYKQLGVEIIFVVYDILPITMPHNFPPESETVHRLWLESVANFADKLVCISQAVADDVTTWLQQSEHPRAGDICVVAWPLGADISASAPSKGIPENGRKLLDRMKKARSFLMVGTIEPRKGHLLVLEAFEQRWLSGSQDLLVIVGAEGWKGVARAGSRSMPTLVSKLRDHPELGKRLIWLETASDEFLQNIYASADALIAASEGEGFGLPLIEAAQYKLPIIARDIPIFREVAGENAYYFSGTTGLDLARALDAWQDLYARGAHPKSDDMPWLTWAQSAERLLLNVLTREGAGTRQTAAHCKQAAKE